MPIWMRSTGLDDAEKRRIGVASATADRGLGGTPGRTRTGRSRQCAARVGCRRALARLGVTSVSLTRDQKTVAVVIVEALGTTRQEARALKPIVEMAVWAAP